MRTVYVFACVILGSALLINYTEACCKKKDLIVNIKGLGNHGLGLSGHGLGLSGHGLGLSGHGCGCNKCNPVIHCGCGCDCDYCSPSYYQDDHHYGCGCCDHHDYDDCDCGCHHGVDVTLKKRIKKKKKTIIKELC